MVELFLAFALEEDLVWVAVFFGEVEWRGNVKVVEKPGDMNENGVAVLRCISAL